MAALNFSNMGRNDLDAPAQGNGQAQGQKKPAAKIWLNYGITITVPTDDGGTEEVFVSAFGVPVDNIEPPKPYTGQNPRMRRIAEAKAMVYHAVYNGGMELEPGAVTPVNGLEAELRRVGVAQTPSTSENPMLEQIEARLKIG